MRPLIHDDFLLRSATARRLYHEFAKDQPIVDYHCHLPPQQILENHQFADLAEIWLGGDHYKWRAMRANGVAERYCTGDASPREKFDAWVATMPYALRNPLYHWSHLELARTFDIFDPIQPTNADRIWNEANAKLADLRTHDLIAMNKVAVICTTDDPADSLEVHAKIAALGLAVRVYPTYRPDKALAVHNPAQWNPWIDRLAATSGVNITSFEALVKALKQRHDDFHAVGCRLSDHGLDQALCQPASPETLEAVFQAARAGKAASADQLIGFGSALLLEFGRWAAEKGWTQQLHLGPLRNVNTRAFGELGPDTGFDTIGDWSQAGPLVRYMDLLEQNGQLPKMVVYNLNPSHNYAVACATGNFQGGVPGKIQYGSGWWFLDQKEGIEWQINALSQLGLLRRFVGMLTDSRSFLSYTRHEYFRRILCNLLGAEVERGELPEDVELIGAMVREISFANAANFFGLDLSPEFTNR